MDAAADAEDAALDTADAEDAAANAAVDAALDAADDTALDALKKEGDNEPIEGTFWTASERSAVHDVEEGMGPMLKSFAVERGGVASRISE